MSYKKDHIVLKRYNGNEIYVCTEGEYMHFLEGERHVHNITIIAETAFQLLDDSVCGDCGGVHIDIGIYSNNVEFNHVTKGAKFKCHPKNTEDEEIIPWFVCCEHIELDNCSVETLDIEDETITLQIHAELWGPSYFGKDKAKTELFYQGTISFVDET